MNKKILINLFLIIAIFPTFSYGMRHKITPNGNRVTPDGVRYQLNPNYHKNNNKVSTGLGTSMKVTPPRMIVNTHKNNNKVSTGLQTSMKVTPLRMIVNTHKGASAKGASAKGASAKGASDKGASDKGASDKGASDKGASAKGASAKGAFSKGRKITLSDEVTYKNFRNLNNRTSMVSKILDSVSKGPDGKTISFTKKEFFEKFKTAKIDYPGEVISKILNATTGIDPNSKKQIKITVFDREKREVMYEKSKKFRSKYTRIKNQEAGTVDSILFEVSEN